MSQVIWDEEAYDELADLWVLATPDEREEIERAVNRANRALRDDPLDAESRAAAISGSRISRRSACGSG